MRIGLIGCGIWGRKILAELQNMGIEVIVVEEDPVQVRSLGPDVKTATLGGTMNSVNGWVIATPASTHRSVIEDLDKFANEAPIFCEKPLVTKTEDAEWLETRKSKAPIYVMHIWTFHPGVQKLKELYSDGVIGDITQIKSIRANWTSPREDVDCLDNLAPHDLSIFLYLLGAMPEPLCAFGESIEGKLVSCLAVLQLENGVKSIFEVSNRYGEKRREIRIHGTTGVLVFKEGKSNFIELIRGDGYILPNQVEAFAYPADSALKSELQAFCRYLTNGNDDELPPLETGIKVVNTLDSIRGLVNRDH